MNKIRYFVNGGIAIAPLIQETAPLLQSTEQFSNTGLRTSLFSDLPYMTPRQEAQQQELPQEQASSGYGLGDYLSGVIELRKRLDAEREARLEAKRKAAEKQEQEDLYVTGSGKFSKGREGLKSFAQALFAAYKKKGASDELAMALVGQDALESAWGTHSHSDVYNFGNIHAYKGWEGKVKKGFDHDADGKKYATKFMAFDSLQDYVNKKWQMLTNLRGRYKLDSLDTVGQFIRKMVVGGYAEDRNYDSALRNMYTTVYKLLCDRS